MTRFNELEQLEIQETLDFWGNLTRDKCAKAKRNGYMKRREALSYLATCRAIESLTASSDKNIKQFWNAAINRWDIDFLRHISVRIKSSYEQYYVIPPICKKERDAYVNRILTHLRKLRGIISKGDVFGAALNDRFSRIVSEFYQPEHIGNQADFENISLHAMMKTMRSEAKLLCDMQHYIGLDGQEVTISEIEQEFLKKSHNKITAYIQFIEDSCRVDNLGSFMEQALSAVRKGHFNPRSSMRPESDYKIFPILPFLDEIANEVRQLKDRGIFYRHHMATGKTSRFKAFGLSVHALVCEISGKRRAPVITAAILHALYPHITIVDHEIRNWLKK